MITLVLGGARSGKSALAERLVLAHRGPVTYFATGSAGEDPDMARRIARHREGRDPRFATIESADLATALLEAPARPLLVDALGTWVAAGPEFSEPPTPTAAGQVPIDRATDRATDPVDWSPWWTQQLDAVCAALDARADRGAPTVLVSDEVGLGVHPESAVGRRFRDVLGLVNQRVAAVADDVLLVVAGRVLRLDHADTLFEDRP